MGLSLKEYNRFTEVLDKKIKNQKILNAIKYTMANCYDDAFFTTVDENKIEFKVHTLQFGIYIRDDGNNILIIDNVNDYCMEFVFNNDETLLYDFKINSEDTENYFYRFKNKRLVEERSLIKSKNEYHPAEYTIKHYYSNDVLISKMYVTKDNTNSDDKTIMKNDVDIFYYYSRLEKTPIMANFNTINRKGNVIETNEEGYKLKLEQKKNVSN